MKIAVHCPDNVSEFSFAPRWVSSFESKGIGVIKADLTSGDCIDKVRDVDGVMWHWFHIPDDKQVAPRILNVIENVMGIPVFPNFATRWHYDEKISQHYLFEALDVPKVPSWVFWHEEEALKFVEKASFPLVFKSSVGAGSTGVMLVRNKDEAISVIGKMFGHGLYPNLYYNPEYMVPKIASRAKQSLKYLLRKDVPRIQETQPDWNYSLQKNYVYFQKFLKDNPYDIRITVIGDRAFGFVRHNRDNDFRASGSGKIDYDLKKIPMKAVQIAKEISSKAGFQSMAYDFLYDEKRELNISEISYGFLGSAVYNCSGYWGKDNKWVEGHYWPEELQAEDFIEYISRASK